MAVDALKCLEMQLKSEQNKAKLGDICKFTVLQLVIGEFHLTNVLVCEQEFLFVTNLTK